MNRLNTKASRDAARQAQFESLIKQGATREDYKNAVLFHWSDDRQFYLKYFIGTAAHATDYRAYSTQERLNQKIADVKAAIDRRETYKKEAKEKNKGHLSSHAAAAAAIRAELKEAFPDIKFSVTSESFSMGNSVRVKWTDGPTSEQVESISGKYQFGSFNGMEDIYEYTNCREDIPQAKYVHETREISEANREALRALVLAYYPKDFQTHDINRKEHELLSRTPLPVGAKITGIEYNETAHQELLVLDLSNVKEAAKTRTQPAHQVAAGAIEIIEHPTRANKILVMGETRPIKEELKRLGGWWNRFEKGWEFRAEKLDVVAEYLQTLGTSGTEPENEPQHEETQPETLPIPAPVIEAVEEAETEQDHTQGAKVIQMIPQATETSQKAEIVEEVEEDPEPVREIHEPAEILAASYGSQLSLF